MQELIKEFNRENLKPAAFIVVVLLLLAVSAYPQRKFGGKVVEIVDGKTAVIQVPTGGRVTVVLQFIEIPEAQQPLRQTVKEHLEKLVLGKTVEFLPRRLSTTESVGQVFLGGVDVSLQMLRDGAAWYSLPEKNGQDAREREAYQTMETQAKTEKRGVWSIENNKPAWEFRAEMRARALEQERSKRAQEQAKRDAERTQADRDALTNALRSKDFAARATVKTKVNATRQLDMWSSVSNSANANEIATGNGLLTGSVPNAGVGYVMTAGDFYDFAGAGATAKVESRSLYIYSSGQTINGNGYVIGFLAQAEKFSFADANNLTITADKQKLNLGKAYRMTKETPYGTQEMLLYKTDAKTLTKIANAKNIEVRLGNYSGKLDDNYQLRIKNLLAVTVN
jgi:endonuclease YncB( thermonuclease family)